MAAYIDVGFLWETASGSWAAAVPSQAAERAGSLHLPGVATADNGHVLQVESLLAFGRMSQPLGSCARPSAPCRWGLKALPRLHRASQRWVQGFSALLGAKRHLRHVDELTGF